MAVTENERRANIKKFVEYWQGRGYEKGESQTFWLSLLSEVLGVERPHEFISFEDQVHLDHTSFIDAFIPSTKVLIEQKSLGKDLNKAIKQSDGSLLTPFQQAKRYIHALLDEKGRDAVPKWVVICNFAEFYIYDMENPKGEPEIIKLQDLEKEWYRLQFLADSGKENLKREMEISLNAGRIVGLLYEALLKQYKNPESPETLKSLNVLCVRLVFCLYAEDADVFGSHLMFHDYLQQYSARQLRKALIELFEVLDTPSEERDPYLDEELAAFPYVNGGLFSDKSIEIPNFTDELRDLLLERASREIDWSEISPTIFGALFESTLNPVTRRSGGMHYTSLENIHKVIDPLFLDDLKAELESVKAEKLPRLRTSKLDEFQKKLGLLVFFDPACGSGNFLTETYLCLRRLENEVLAIRSREQMSFAIGDWSPVQVSIDQFYGIEINDFAVTVAKTALWIAESQMIKETEDIIKIHLDFLPLKTNAHIVEGNALRLDWESVVPKDKLNYIIGNPPFVGARLMSKEQKGDLFEVFGSKWKNAGNLDYVSCWYKKCVDLIAGTDVLCALVSTNSVSQGEQVPILWRPLFERGLKFNFAYKTFKWNSESSDKANVHCVIIGFSVCDTGKEKVIYSGELKKKVKNINAYLIEADNIFVDNRKTPLCKEAPEARSGNKPIDGGFYLFTPDEYEEFVKLEPKAQSYFKRWYGAEEFINSKVRYCLWLGECPPHELRKMPRCLERVDQVRKYRLASDSPGTVKLADKPTRFHVETLPKDNFLVMPLTSSERRRYVPIGFMTPEALASNLVTVVMKASLYDFGVLTSNVFMSWMRAVCGRLEMRYRITVTNVYNNFPWPEPTEEQKAKIEKTAQAILDARNLYPDNSLAVLYDDLLMPPELRRAHQANDRAVMEAYGLSVKDTTESSCAAHLMGLYEKLTAAEN